MNLPNIYQNKNIKISNNVQDLFYGSSNNNINKKDASGIKKDIRNDIKKLFASQNYVYKLKCTITTKNKTLTNYIIGQTNNHLITIDNELIPINDIIDIEEKY